MPAPQEAKADTASWYNSSWLYRKPVTIDNTSGTSTLTNYQVKVTVLYDSKMQSNFNDIRFTDLDGTTLLDHWLEVSTSSVSATFWVEVPNIAATSTKTIYMYYGNSSATSTSNGDNTFEFFDDFENYDVGNLVVNPGQWTKYGSNPVLSLGTAGAWDDEGATFASVLRDGTEYKMYYHGWNVAGTSQIGLATSSDGITWTKHGSNPIIASDLTETNLRVPVTWKEGSTYHMIYTYSHSGAKIGHATSIDGITWTRDSGNPVFQASDTGWSGTIENWSIIKVGGTYYMYYSELTATGDRGRRVGLAYTNNLSDWVEYKGSPILDSSSIPSDKKNGQFCANVFKYGDYYYLLVPSYAKVSDFAWLYLYKSTNIDFSDKQFVRVALVGDSLTWDRRDLDTPWILTDDITRVINSDPLWMYYAGNDEHGLWHVGLVQEPSIGSALSAAIEPKNIKFGGEGGVQIDGATIKTGSRSLKQYKDSSHYTTIYADFNSAITSGILEAWVRRSSTGNGYYDIYTYNQAYVTATGAGLNVGPLFRYWDSTGAHNTAIAFAADTWYLFRFEFNATSGTYNFIILNTSLSEIFRLNDISFKNSVTSFSRIAIQGQTNLVGNGFIDDIKIRKLISPEPSISLASEETIPIVPTIGNPTVLSSSAIRWNFTDNADNETGFRVYTNADAIATSSATANLTYLDETGLSENTQYTRYVKAYNSYGESASSSATSTYALADTPTNLTTNSAVDQSITVSVDTFPNATSGSSGYYFSQGSHNSGWIQTNSWQDSNLSCANSYTYNVKYRNGNAVETATTTQTFRTPNCGGAILVIPPITTINPPINLSQPQPSNQPPFNPITNISTTFSFQAITQLGTTNLAVKYLQIILNQNPDTQLTQTGVGSPGKETNFFGPLTKQALIKFQEKYKEEILKPWGLTKGTGFLGKTTQAKLNQLLGR
ncbi:MAG: DUF2341 domain-containing protein [Candidatus Gribaldobacteria bacterium]|nr:DUF2341 domain-containing protein [Candidatus Gribaldobacteria bacterium]